MVRGIERARRRGEIRRQGRPGDVGVAGVVHGDALAIVAAAAAEEGRIDEGAARRIELRHKGVADAIRCAGERRTERSRRRREIGR